MSGYPLVLRGERIVALVVGGGPVAERKALALLDAGAQVRVVAPAVTASLRSAAAERPDQLSLALRQYAPGDIGEAVLVVAATSSREVNARVAADATALHRLANVTDRPEDGNCTAVAAHRAGELLVAVSAGGVPAAAARVRDAVAERFDGRYAEAVRALAALRRRLLDAGDASAWRAAASALVGDDFCAAVESGGFAERVAAWR